MDSSNSTEEYILTCKKLDSLAIRILSILQTIILEREYLSENLKDGFIHMAKSRYLMRGQKINIHQVNTPSLRSSVKVLNKTEVEDGIEFHAFELSGKAFSNRVFESTKHRTKKACEDELVDDFEKCSLNGNNEPDENLHSAENNGTIRKENPLRWFGILVPESLRNCQSRFMQATVTASKLASLQNQLKATCHEYRVLKTRKEKLR